MIRRTLVLSLICGSVLCQEDFAALAARALDGPDREAARAKLEAAVQADYPAVHAAWQKALDGRAKAWLEHLLLLPEVEEAEVVLRGRIARIETIQGGVIDYHQVVVWFEKLEIVSAPDDERAVLAETGTFVVARGTHDDSWLCAVIRRDLERIEGVRTWAFRARDLRSGDAGGNHWLRVRQYTLLPAAAADVLKE